MRLSCLSARSSPFVTFFFFFNDTATTEIYTLSLHDALPISSHGSATSRGSPLPFATCHSTTSSAKTYGSTDRKSTRLNSSHGYISYAVFCLKKKKILYLLNTGVNGLNVYNFTRGDARIEVVR